MNCTHVRVLGKTIKARLYSECCKPKHGKPTADSPFWYKIKWERYQEYLAHKRKPYHKESLVCTWQPERKPVEPEWFCAQFALRENFEQGYQDIERICIEVERVYETRIDCMAVPEGVRRAA
jgi:hypothetical protein